MNKCCLIIAQKGGMALTNTKLLDWTDLNQGLDWRHLIGTKSSALSSETWPFSLDWLPKSACLVGGTVRDALLGRSSDYLDLDFVLPEQAVDTAKAIARHHGAGFVLLDAERQIARVVFEQGTADFAQQVGESLEIDLQRRDFTVNAIAYNPHTNELIDPLQGYLDLQKGLLRMVSATNLQEDPLRLLRAYRQAAQLGFELEAETRLTIRQFAPLLKQIAAERVQSELGYLLSTPNGTPWLTAAWADKLLQDWFPHATAAGLAQVAEIDRATHRLQEAYPILGAELYRHIRNLPKGGRTSTNIGFLAMSAKPVNPFSFQKREKVIQPRGDSGRNGMSDRNGCANPSKAHSGESSAPPAIEASEPSFNPEPKASGSARTWLTTAKLASLVAADAQQAEADLWRLKYSRVEIQAVSTLLKFVPEVRSFSSLDEISLRDQYFLFQGIGVIFPALALLALAIGIPLPVMAPLIDRFLTPGDPVAHPTPLITGQHLMAALSLTPGPRIGQLLARVQLAQAEGEISTPAEALEFAAQLLE